MTAITAQLQPLLYGNFFFFVSFFFSSVGKMMMIIMIVPRDGTTSRVEVMKEPCRSLPHQMIVLTRSRRTIIIPSERFPRLNSCVIFLYIFFVLILKTHTHKSRNSLAQTQCEPYDQHLPLSEVVDVTTEPLDSVYLKNHKKEI